MARLHRERTGWLKDVPDLVAELGASSAGRYARRFEWSGREWRKRVADHLEDLNGSSPSRRSAGWLFPIDELGSRPDPFGS